MNIEDERKLMCVLGYLKGTADTLMIRASSEAGNVVAYVDAVYALHSDSKSRTGVIVYVSGTLAYIASRRQKCMS